MDYSITDKDRSLDKLYNFKTGKVKSAIKVLNASTRSQVIVRRKIEEKIRIDKAKYGCAYCGQIVKLAAHKPTPSSVQSYYFKHLNGSGDCIRKKDTQLTYDNFRQQKYNGAKESPKHKAIKDFIHINIACDSRFSDIAQEKYLRSKKGWSYGRRRPDVSAKLHDLQIAFEIQLSTEFLSIVTAREMFYEEELHSILWIFSEFNPHDYKNRKTMHDDIISLNHMNALSISENSKALTKDAGELIFDGHYCIPIYDPEKQEIIQEWHVKPVSFGDLVFDIHTKKPYFSHYENLLKIENHKKRQHKEDIKRKSIEIAEKTRIRKEYNEKSECIRLIERHLFSEWDNISSSIDRSNFTYEVKRVFTIDLDSLDENEWLSGGFYTALRAAFSIRHKTVRVKNQHGNWRWLVNDILFYRRAKYYLPLARGIKAQGLLFKIFDPSDFTKSDKGQIIISKPGLTKTARKHLEVTDKLKKGDIATNTARKHLEVTDKLKKSDIATNTHANSLLDIIAKDEYAI